MQKIRAMNNNIVTMQINLDQVAKKMNNAAQYGDLQNKRIMTHQSILIDVIGSMKMIV